MTTDGSPLVALARGGVTLLIVAAIYLAVSRIHPEPVAAREGTAVIHPWAKGGARSGTVMPMYVVLENNGMTQERLLGISSPMADHIVINRLVLEAGLIRAANLQEIVLPPGGRLAFRPGERQLTLIGARVPIEPGSFIPLTFTFERGGKLTANLRVENMSEPEHDDHF